MKISLQVITTLTGMITGDDEASPIYRTRIDLENFFEQFGKDKIEGVYGDSRGKYVKACLIHLNNTPTVSEVITKTLDPRDYNNSENNIEDAVNHLNTLLIYDGYQIIKENLRYICIPSNQNNSTDIKNIIFAADGPKPEIVLLDATTNEIKIVKNAEFCLVYNRQLNYNGLLWSELVDWWANQIDIQDSPFKKQANSLYSRLLKSINENEVEKLLFSTYYFQVCLSNRDTLPALIPQVYLHYDPKTIRELNGEKRLSRQRMDFLMLLPNGKKVVIEIDGKQHYSTNDKANPRLYAEMVEEDRRLKLAGYEVYRFGGYEFINEKDAKQKILDFFTSLLDNCKTSNQ